MAHLKAEWGVHTITVLGGLIVLLVWSFYKKQSKTYHSDSASLTLLTIALGLLNENDRERYSEEWHAVLFDQETATLRIQQAVGFMKAAMTISVETQVLVPVQQSIHKIGFKLKSSTAIGFIFMSNLGPVDIQDSHLL